MSEKLAITGGTPVVTAKSPDFSTWPIVTEEDERAILDVLHARSMSGGDVTALLEAEYAKWEGSEFALASNNGTSAIHCAMYGLGIGRGDEVITPTWTFWATHTQLMNLGATPVFCDLDPRTLCPCPKDVEARITPRTKAIIVVHMFGYPADMDAFMDIAQRHGIGILEDYSHSHASTWKGRKVGSIGHVGAASIMSGKPLATGEGGMLNTNDRDIYERAIMFGHGDHLKYVQNEEYRRLNMPWGGYKYRMHQMTSAMARVQLAHYDEYRMPGVMAMERFFRQVCTLPGVSGNFPIDDPDAYVGSSYTQRVIVDDSILARAPVTVIAEAIRAEGVAGAGAGGYFCHHLHPYFNECDVYGDGKPTRIAFSDRDVRQGVGDCPNAEKMSQYLLRVPRMIQYDEPYVDQLAEAYVKVLSNLDQLEGMTSEEAVERGMTLG